MKLNFLVFFLFLFVADSMYSQIKLLEGSIVSEVDIELEGLNIQNLTSGKNTITNAKGEFQIYAALNETLSISAIHIQTILIIVEEEHMLTSSISINLLEKLNELEAVNLRRTSLLGFLSSDANLIPTKQVISASSLGLPNADMPKWTRTKRSLYTATTSPGGIPVDPLINLISGRTKMLKNRLKRENRDNLTLKLLEKFPETYFINSLEIEQRDIYSFIFFCEDDSKYDNIMTQSTIEIIEFLERKSLEYISERKGKN